MGPAEPGRVIVERAGKVTEPVAVVANWSQPSIPDEQPTPAVPTAVEQAVEVVEPVAKEKTPAKTVGKLTDWDQKPSLPIQGPIPSEPAPEPAHATVKKMPNVKPKAPVEPTAEVVEPAAMVIKPGKSVAEEAEPGQELSFPDKSKKPKSPAPVLEPVVVEKMLEVKPTIPVQPVSKVAEPVKEMEKTVKTEAEEAEWD